TPRTWTHSHPSDEDPSPGTPDGRGDRMAKLRCGNLFRGDCDFLNCRFFASCNGFVLSHPFARKKAKGWGTERRNVGHLCSCGIERKETLSSTEMRGASRRRCL